MVDGIFNDKFGETAGKGQIARLDGIKRKRVVFTLALRRLKVMWQIEVKESHICKLSEI